jgi:hypothetical protein
VKLALSLPLAALMLAGCGEGTGSAAKSGANPAAGKPAAPQTPAATGDPAQTAPVTTQGEAADDMLDEEGGDMGVNELLGVIEDLPTQDELDAAAAARITEEMADSEYERLKAEIEAELANPPAEDEAAAEGK